MIFPKVQPAVIIAVTNGDKLLLTKYKPGIGAYDMFSGGIPVTLQCDTPWYPRETMYTSMDKDRNLAIQLFYRYIGKYEFIIFCFPG